MKKRRRVQFSGSEGKVLLVPDKHYIAVAIPGRVKSKRTAIRLLGGSEEVKTYLASLRLSTSENATENQTSTEIQPLSVQSAAASASPCIPNDKTATAEAAAPQPLRAAATTSSNSAALAAAAAASSTTWNSGVSCLPLSGGTGRVGAAAEEKLFLRFSMCDETHNKFVAFSHQPVAGLLLSVRRRQSGRVCFHLLGKVLRLHSAEGLADFYYCPPTREACSSSLLLRVLAHEGESAPSPLPVVGERGPKAAATAKAFPFIPPPLFCRFSQPAQYNLAQMASAPVVVAGSIGTQAATTTTTSPSAHAVTADIAAVAAALGLQKTVTEKRAAAAGASAAWFAAEVEQKKSQQQSPFQQQQEEQPQEQKKGQPDQLQMLNCLAAVGGEGQLTEPLEKSSASDSVGAASPEPIAVAVGDDSSKHHIERALTVDAIAACAAAAAVDIPFAVPAVVEATKTQQELLCSSSSRSSEDSEKKYELPSEDGGVSVSASLRQPQQHSTESGAELALEEVRCIKRAGEEFNSVCRFADKSVPTQPPLAAVKAAADSSLILLLQSLLQKHPIWLRSSLDALLPDEYTAWRRKPVYAKSCYFFVDGPWRGCLCRLGYDPRLSADSKLAQTIDFRDPFFRKVNWRRLHDRHSQSSHSTCMETHATTGSMLAKKPSSSVDLAGGEASSTHHQREVLKQQPHVQPTEAVGLADTGHSARNIEESSLRNEGETAFLSLHSSRSGDSVGCSKFVLAEQHFLAPPSRPSVLYQLREIQDEAVQKLINEAPVLSTVCKETGWFHASTMKTLRDLLAMRSQRMREKQKNLQKR